MAKDVKNKPQSLCLPSGPPAWRCGLFLLVLFLLLVTTASSTISLSHLGLLRLSCRFHRSLQQANVVGWAFSSSLG